MNNTTIEPGDVLIGTTGESPLQGPYRVLEIIRRFDKVTLIPIPIGPRKTEGRKQANYYARGFLSQRFSHLTGWLEKNVLSKTTIELPSHWHLSDIDLRELSPPKSDPSIPIEDRHRSPLEIKRNFKWKLIEPLIPVTAEIGKTRPPDLTCLDALVRERASEVGVSVGQLFDALHRYYAFGCIKNALLPNNIGRSGAPGKPRRAKKNVKLGRKNEAAKAGNTELAGLILDEEHVQNIRDGYMMFVRPGTTVTQAFLSMSSTFYCSGHTMKHGHLIPNLLDAHLRPTESEFRYHGPRAEDATAAARRLMGEGDWARNYRPLLGTVRDGIPTIGQVGSLDASPVDVNFVACGDPLQPIGVGRGLFVRDAWLGLYFGWTIGLGGFGTNDAKLAILRAATDKSSLLARYNLDLPPEDFPALFFSKYLSDNGELRSCDGIESIVDELTSRIEFIASGRADRNSASESGHHSRHRQFDHHITGTTKGRQTKRGEPLAITKALLSRYEYTRLLLLWIHWANTKQTLPLHMVPTEMRREFSARGKTPERTRIEIYRWAKANGYVSGKPVDPTYLRAHLLPKFTASVQRSGLILHRPNNGNAVELLHGARFNHEYLAYSGIIRDALSRGSKHIEVSADPDDLSQIIFIDKNGTHVIPNIKDDVILIHEGGIPDLCAINDVEKLHAVETASTRDQDAIDQQSFRKEVEADAKEKRKIAQSIAGQNKQKSAKSASVRAAQRFEKRAQLDDEISRQAGRGDSCSQHVQEPSATPVRLHPQRPISTRMQDLMKNRLSRFNAERKL
ncbi:hypothetical protein [Collimonas humicola]|uniref:hypothetical protein n=1 Tax=Collimonas humicola TaxID=2825886 RepID=UPI001B8B6B10|nr:hypothetical protein [Collimonas humicola]